MRQHLQTGIWRLLLLLLLLLITLCSVVDVLVNTAAGSRFLLEQVLGSTGRLRIVWRQGALNGAIDLDRLDWHARTFDLHLSGVSARMSWRHGWQGQWWIDDLKIQQAELDFPQHKPAVTVLHRFWSPLELVIRHGQVDRITVQRGVKRYENYQLTLHDGHWVGTQVRVAGLGLVHPAMQAEIHGWIRLQDDYPLSASGYMRWPMLEAAGMTPWRLNLDNTLEHMKVQAVTVGGSVPITVQAVVQTTYPHLPYQGWAVWRQVNWPWLSSQQLQSEQGTLHLAGDLQSYRGRADLQLQGRWLPRGQYTLIGQGTFHDLSIAQWLYHGLGGEGTGHLNLEFGHHQLDWSWVFEPRHIRLFKQWPALRLYFPEWSGSWQSQGHARDQQSHWSLSGTTPQGEHWQGEGQVAAWVSRLDLPYTMEFNGEQVTRVFPHLGQVRLPKLKFQWQGPWKDHRGLLQAELRSSFWPILHARVETRAYKQQWHVQTVQLQSEQGSAEFKGDALYQAGWSWQGQIQTHALNPAALWLSWPGKLDTDAVVQGNWSTAGWSLHLTSFKGSGQLRNVPLQAEFSEGEWRTSASPRAVVRQGVVDWGSAHVQVDGEWGKQVVGQLKATAFDLSSWNPDWHGIANGEVKISGPIDQPDIQSSFTGKDLHIGKVAAQEAQGSLQWLQGGRQHSQLIVSLGTPQWGAQTLQSLDIKVDGTLDAQRISWDADGVDGHLQGQGQGAWRAQDQLWAGKIDDASIRLKAMNWSITQPFDLSFVWPARTLRVSHHCWVHAQASLCLRDDLQVGDRGDVHLTLSNLQAADLNDWLPPELRWQGLLHGEGQILWSANSAHPDVHLDMEAAQGQVLLQQDQGKALVLPYQRLALESSLQSGVLDSQLQLEADQLGQARIHAHVDTQQAVHVLSGDVHVSHLAVQPLRVFFPQMQSLSGWLNAEGILSGSLEQPGYAGYVQLTDGQVEGKQHVFALSHIQARADIDGEHAHWTGQFDSGKEGQATVVADSQWANGALVTAGSLKGHGLSLQKVPLVESSLDPDLQFSVKSHEINVQGRIKVQEADVRMRDSGDASLQPSPDVMVDRQSGSTGQRSQPWKLIYDIEVLLGDKVTFRGFDADGRLTGQVGVQQDAQGVMSAHGEIDMDPETSFRSYGQNLRLRKGRLIFLGPPTNPQVDVEAVKDFDPNVTVGVHITGWSNQLQSTLISDNQLSQDEISSYLIFGHAPERQQALFGVNNSAIPAGALPGVGAPVNNSKMAALQVGAFGGQKVADSLGEAIGVRDLSLSTEGVGTDTQVALGAYLVPSLYVSYGVGVFTPVNSLTLRYRINQSFYLQAVSALQNAIDLFYTWNF